MIKNVAVIFGRCRDYVRLYLDLERPEVGETQSPSVELCGDLTGDHAASHTCSNRPHRVRDAVA